MTGVFLFLDDLEIRLIIVVGKRLGFRVVLV